MLPKYKQLKQEIATRQAELLTLKIKLTQTCPHPDKEIEHDSYCADDWAFPNEYTTTYHCKVCGCFASSNDVDKTMYMKLQEKYNKAERKKRGLR